MADPEKSISERMRADWNQRAREDAHYYVAFGGRDQDEAGFLATAADVLRSIEAQLKRLPAKANRRAWRALEIGCGPGRLVKPLSRHFGEIHGVDVSDEMIRLARERLADIPHAHFHATDGASLALFADDSFDFIYSYAVFQHIPSRDVVLEYMRETARVLKPGGIFHGQFNGLSHPGDTNTWSGVVFSAADIRAFTRDNGLELLNLDGEHTQYMWTTWRLASFHAAPSNEPASIHRITNAYTSEPLIPQRGRLAALSILVKHLPSGCDLNNLEVLADGEPGVPVYVGPADSDWSPAGECLATRPDAHRPGARRDSLQWKAALPAGHGSHRASGPARSAHRLHHGRGQPGAGERNRQRPSQSSDRGSDRSGIYQQRAWMIGRCRTSRFSGRTHARRGTS